MFFFVHCTLESALWQTLSAINVELELLGSYNAIGLFVDLYVYLGQDRTYFSYFFQVNALLGGMQLVSPVWSVRQGRMRTEWGHTSANHALETLTRSPLLQAPPLQSSVCVSVNHSAFPCIANNNSIDAQNLTHI